MSKILSILLFCGTIAVVTKGTVAVAPVKLCGADAAYLDLRIQNCSLTPCSLATGVRYDTALDFTAMGASNELTLKLSVHLPELEFVIMETSIPGSSVSPGQSFTIAYTMTLNNIVAGGEFDLEFKLSDSVNKDVFACVKAPVKVDPITV